MIPIPDFIFRCLSSQQVSAAVHVDEDRAASANHQNWLLLCFSCPRRHRVVLVFPWVDPDPHSSVHLWLLFRPLCLTDQLFSTKRSPLILSSVELLEKCCKITAKVQLLQLKPFLALTLKLSLEKLLQSNIRGLFANK